MRMFISGYNRILNHLNTLRVDAKIFVSAKKYLRKKKFPDTCGHGLRFSANKIHCSPRDQSLSVYYYPYEIDENVNTENRDIDKQEQASEKTGKQQPIRG